MSSRFRFVYFDLDDTLLDHRLAERRALADLSVVLWRDESIHLLSRLQELYHTRNRELWHAYADGEITRDRLRELRFQHIVDRFELHGTPWQVLDDLYMRRYAAHWTTIPGARDAFEVVAGAIDVGVVTNGFAEVQRAKLERFPFIRARSKAIIISEEVGFLKPDLRLFEAAEKAAGVSGDGILYVGDSYRADILGAAAAGWKSAWYTDSATEPLPEGSFAFSDWTELRNRTSGCTADCG